MALDKKTIEQMKSLEKSVSRDIMGRGELPPIEEALAEIRGESKQGFFKETAADIKQGAQGVRSAFQQAGESIQREVEEGTTLQEDGTFKQGTGSTLLQAFGEGAKGVGRSIGEVFEAGVKALLPQRAEERVKEGIETAVGAVAPKVQQVVEDTGLDDWWESLPEEGRDNIKAQGEILLTLVEGLGIGRGARPVSRAAKELTQQTVDLAQQGLSLTSPVVRNFRNAGQRQVSNAMRVLRRQAPQNAEDAAELLTQNYKKSFSKKASVNNKLQKLSAQKGIEQDELIRNLAREGYAPSVAEDLSDMTPVFEDLANRKAVLATAIDDTLSQFNQTTPLDTLQQRVKQFAQETPTINSAELDKTLREIDRKFNSFRTAYGNAVTPLQLNKIRKDMNQITKAFNKEIFDQDAANVIAQQMGQRIDEIVPNEVVKKTNKKISELFTLEDTARIFNNQKIDIGILGNTLGRFLGAVGVGAIAAPISGPGSLVIAGLAATYGGDFVADMIRKGRFNSKITNVIKKELSTNDELLEALKREATKENRKFLEQFALPAPKEGSPRSQVNVPPELPTQRMPDEPSVPRTN